MPSTMFAGTNGSFAADRVHKGPGQAGNKSALTYRCDIGVPGYTGYIPQTAAIPLQVKGSTKYIGRVSTAQHHEAAADVPDFNNTSWYQKQFQADPASYKRLTKEGGGYWFTKVPQGPNRPFTAGSTYHAELQRGGPTAQHQLEGTVGLRSTTSCYGAACRDMVSSGTIKSRPASVRQPLGFRTMYNSMHGEQIELSRAYAGSLAGTATGCNPAGTAPNATAVHAIKTVGSASVNRSSTAQTVPSVGAAAEGDSSYSKDFGKYGDDPLQHGVDSANEMTRSGTTADLAAGTARPTMQRPGYTGFVPESPVNWQARQQASAVDQPREDNLAKSMLFTLDQYSRQMVPLYTGHRATALSNLSAGGKAPEPTTRTTQGYANHLATQRPHTVDNSNFLDSKKGIMGFFNTGSSLFASDNGLAEAQKFYQSKGRRGSCR